MSAQRRGRLNSLLEMGSKSFRFSLFCSQTGCIGGRCNLSIFRFQRRFGKYSKRVMEKPCQMTQMYLSMSELKAVLFGRGPCPHCGGKLMKERYSEIKSGTEVEWTSTAARDNPAAYMNPDVRINCVGYKFVCQSCRREVPLVGGT